MFSLVYSSFLSQSNNIIRLTGPKLLLGVSVCVPDDRLTCGLRLK